jgi:hypothetical protein
LEILHNVKLSSLSYDVSFTADRLFLNVDETNVIKFIANTSPHFTLIIGYKEEYVGETVTYKISWFTN